LAEQELEDLHVIQAQTPIVLDQEAGLEEEKVVPQHGDTSQAASLLAHLVEDIPAFFQAIL
jgi:hypothetical protein